TSAVAVDLQPAGHHHRCYREKATDRFIITGKRGIEMIDLAGTDHSRNNWIRGACQYGVMPANGLLYAPSHACGCYMESKLRGFWALAPKQNPDRVARSETPRLERGRAYGKSETQTPAPRSSHDWPMYRHDPLRSGVAGTVVPTDLERAWKASIGGRLTQPVIAGGKVLLASVDENTVYALDEESGDVVWKHVAGARVDSPPAIHEGMALFGSADGRVTCLRLGDGELVWRFRAAPTDLRTVAYDQVESLWPVHGSVLLLSGVAYCSAGRSTWLDGGIDLFALDPATGNVLHQARFQSKHPEFQEGKDRARPEHETRVDQSTTDYKTFLAPDLSDSFSMAGGTVSDVLTSDGKNVFLHQVKFNASLEKQDEMSRHLFSTSSLLDSAENHRSHWVLGTGDFSRVPVAYSWVVNRPGKRMPTIAVPTGVMMVFDGQALWGVRRQGDANGRYHLFKKENQPFSEKEAFLPDFRRMPAEEADPSVWKNDFPVRTTAMLKSGDHLFIGVAPVEVPEEDPHAAYEGRTGGSVWVCSERDGAKVAEHRLDSPVAWDGMAAAAGKLFVATADGSVLCLQ
ncbi:MAG: PQQ-binding-like beta-propeller repeat protein, partial [Planctomycetes bacterium]|nr:PQQ-binding-like beta-propeller repeat protein [Planctomycetota bacterium]